MQFAGGGLIFSGTNGGANGSPFYILGSADIALPLVNWTVIATNYFSVGGGFNVTNPLYPSVPQAFFILQLP